MKTFQSQPSLVRIIFGVLFAIIGICAIMTSISLEATALLIWEILEPTTIYNARQLAEDKAFATSYAIAGGFLFLISLFAGYIAYRLLKTNKKSG